MSYQTIFRAGNSLAISLPSRLVKKLGLQAGQQVAISYDLTQSQLVVDFPDQTQLSLLNKRES